MEKTNQNYCVILAGGKGRRLWPCSRENRPKQFIDFFGVGRTQLQTTFDRFSKVIPLENIFICTCREYLSMVKEQLPDFPERNILVEPVNRNTAPSVAWANMRIKRTNPDANIIITPSDQLVMDEASFMHSVETGLSYVAEHDVLLAMGVKPTRPEPGYGYIQLGDDHFKSFESIFPSVLRNLKFEKPTYSYDEELEYVAQNYPRYPNLSIDYAILEHSEDIYVMKCDFGWADLGTWHAVYECMSKVEGDNVVVDSEVVLEDARNNVIKLPKGRLAVINGLDGYIVAEEDNVLLICKKGDSSALVRKYVSEVQIKYGDEFV